MLFHSMKYLLQRELLGHFYGEWYSADQSSAVPSKKCVSMGLSTLDEVLLWGMFDTLTVESERSLNFPEHHGDRTPGG